MTQLQQQPVQQARQYVGEPTFAASRIKLDLPPKFDGKPQNLNPWIFAVEQYCLLVGMTVPTDMVKLAVSRLEKNAFTWWRQLTSKGSSYMLGALEWSDFKSDLVEAFSDVARELKLRRKLQELKQWNVSGGTVQNFTREFRQLVLELGDAAPDEGALLFTYMEGLKRDVQLQVLLARPQMLTEAEQVAERADVAYFSQRNSHQNQGQKKKWQHRNWQPHCQWPQQQYGWRPPPPPPPRSGPVPMDLGNLQGNRRQGSGLKQPPRYPPGKSNVTCYRCGKSGHIAKNCRVKLPQQPGVYHLFDYQGQPSCGHHNSDQGAWQQQPPSMPNPQVNWTQLTPPPPLPLNQTRGSY